MAIGGWIENMTQTETYSTVRIKIIEFSDEYKRKERTLFLIPCVLQFQKGSTRASILLWDKICLC